MLQEFADVFARLKPGETPMTVERLGSLTNRVYKVVTASGSYVLRVPGVGSAAYIDRAAEIANLNVAARAGLAPAPLAIDADGTIVLPYVESEILTDDSVRRILPAVASALRSLHGLPSFRGSCEPFGRIRSFLDVLGTSPQQVKEVKRILRSVEQALEAERVASRPCHGDPWLRNLLSVDGRILFVDWEFSGMGDPAWDLAHVIVESDLGESTAAAFVEGYVDGGRCDDLLRRVALFEPVADVLWGVWGLLQWTGGSDAEDFEAYAASRFDAASRRFSTARFTDALRDLEVRRRAE